MIPSDAVVHDAATLLLERIGLRPDIAFQPRVARAVRDLAASDHSNTDSVSARLRSDPMLFDRLVDLVTVQETAFFRHPEQFDTLRRHVLADRIGPVKAWSAACANGQEAYSLAMVLNDHHPGGAVLATDVSPQAVERARLARYTDREMVGIPDAQIERRFHRHEGEWEVDAGLRHTVTVRRHNLLDAVPPDVAECDVVFCRNVLIYLDQLHAERFLDRLADSMKATAVLFLGSAETLWHIDRRFETVALGDGYVHRVKPRRRTSTSTQAPPSPRARPAPAKFAHVTPTPPPETDVAAIARTGRDLLAKGDRGGAVTALRKWAYLAPDDPTAHFHLGIALRGAGDERASTRAFRSALAALERCEPNELARTLGGYDISEFRRMLENAGAADVSPQLPASPAPIPSPSHAPAPVTG